MSTEPTCTWSGYFSARAVNSGVIVRAKAATLTPESIKSLTMASPRPREPPETSTTDDGGTWVGPAPAWAAESDIALQRLLLRNLVQEPDPARYAVVRQPGTAPLHQVGIGDRAHLRVRDHFGGHHPADQRGLTGEDPGPGHGRVIHQHVADQAGRHLGPAD